MTSDPFADNPWHHLDVPEDAEYVLATYTYREKDITVEAGLFEGLSPGMQKDLYEAFKGEGIGHLDDGKQQTVALPGPAWNADEIATRIALLES